MNEMTGLEMLAARVFYSWKTTAIAAVIYGAIAYSYFAKDVEFDKLIGWIGMATTFLFTGDAGGRRRIARVKAMRAQQP